MLLVDRIGIWRIAIIGNTLVDRLIESEDLNPYFAHINTDDTKSKHKTMVTRMLTEVMMTDFVCYEFVEEMKRVHAHIPLRCLEDWIAIVCDVLVELECDKQSINECCGRLRKVGRMFLTHEDT